MPAYVMKQLTKYSHVAPLQTTALPVFTQSHQIWQRQQIALPP
jgi:hypothetical protein